MKYSLPRQTNSSFTGLVLNNVHESSHSEPKVEGQQDKEESKGDPPVTVQCSLDVNYRIAPDEGSASLGGPTPGSVSGMVIQRLAPAFILEEVVGPRSNADPATTTTENPTFVGSVTKNDKKKQWAYKLDSVEARGKITLVYYTEDHYPAPTPTDDSGELTNVTNSNWKDIVKDLKKNRTRVAGSWSAYRRTQLHERYHWEGEWQKLVIAGVKKAEKKIGKLSATFADAATEADADKKLHADAKKIFDDTMKNVRDKWNKMGDSPGDPPYRAGAVGADALRSRVSAHAKALKWK